MSENAGPGRETVTSTLHIMWNGIWVALGDAEFLVEEGEIVKVLSFTPKEFGTVATDVNDGEAL